MASDDVEATTETSMEGAIMRDKLTDMATR